MYSHQIRLSLVFSFLFVALIPACGPADGTPSPEICEPASDARSESCWLNDQEKLRVTTADDLTQICESRCSKVEDLRIINIDGLENLEFLRGMTRIDVLSIGQNPDLKSLDGLDQVDSITEALDISGNPNLEDLTALENSLTSLKEGFVIGENKSLKSLDGLQGLEAVNTEGNARAALTIASNPKLKDLSGLESIESIPKGRVRIWDNENLTAIDGFGKLIELETLQIYQNRTLNDVTSLYGLEKISKNLDISDNPKLPQCQVDKIVTDAEVMGRTEIGGNGEGECR